MFTLPKMIEAAVNTIKQISEQSGTLPSTSAFFCETSDGKTFILQSPPLESADFSYTMTSFFDSFDVDRYVHFSCIKGYKREQDALEAGINDEETHGEIIDCLLFLAEDRLGGECFTLYSSDLSEVIMKSGAGAQIISPVKGLLSPINRTLH